MMKKERTLKPSLDLLVDMATHAGEILQSFIGKDLGIQHKSRTDLVTLADHASEKYLIEQIRGEFQNHKINAEESGELAGTAEHQWYLDPLDGTINYAHGIPIYSVSIGYAFQGKMELGVIYDPIRREIFSAQRGRGATLNGKPIHVSHYVDLIDCLLATGFPKDVWGTSNDNTANFLQFTKMTQAVRRLGSAALDVVYVAAGRLDGFWEPSINDWDIAAGGLIVREAGGIVTNIYGEPGFLNDPISIVAANPAIHPKMLQVLKDIRGKTVP